MSSITFSSGSLSRTASLPNPQLFTACWWQRFTSATPGQYATSFSIDNDGSNVYCQVSTNASNQVIFDYRWGSNPSTTTNILHTCDAVWRFYALVRNGTGTASSRLYHATRGSAFTSVQVDNQGALPSPDGIYWGTSGFADVFPGQMRNAKLWSGVAFTAAELAAEMYSTKPVRWGGLWFWNPLLVVASAGTDLSGAAHAFTPAGTLALSDTQDPGIPWSLAA